MRCLAKRGLIAELVLSSVARRAAHRYMMNSNVTDQGDRSRLGNDAHSNVSLSRSCVEPENIRIIPTIIILHIYLTHDQMIPHLCSYPDQTQYPTRILHQRHQQRVKVVKYVSVYCSFTKIYKIILMF